MTDSFIVLNGDVLTTLDLAELVRAHKASGNILTIAAHRRDNALRLRRPPHRGRERPDRGLHREARAAVDREHGGLRARAERVDYIPSGRHFDFPDLVHELLLRKLPVGSHLFDGVWFDIGRHEDYELAAAAWEAEPETGELPPALGEAAGRL